MRVAVLGANGQLGSDVMAALVAAGHEALGLTHSDADITDAPSVRRALGETKPDTVVNTAAMNHVEGCERDPERALAVNGAGVRNVAVATREIDAQLVHISTDYVFGGEKTTPYVESDLPAPLNAYGTSKLAGEYFVAALQPRHFIVRTSALFGVHRCRAKPQDNFVRAMLKLAREQDTFTVVASERVSPTWTMDLSRQILSLIETEHYGIYHATSQGECSWYEFAKAITEIAGLPARVEPKLGSKSGDLRRPSYSVLENAALQRLGMDVMPHWRDAVRGYLEAIGETATAAPVGDFRDRRR